MKLKTKKVIAREFLYFIITILLSTIIVVGFYAYNTILLFKINRLKKDVILYRAQYDSLSTPYLYKEKNNKILFGSINDPKAGDVVDFSQVEVVSPQAWNNVDSAQVINSSPDISTPVKKRKILYDALSKEYNIGTFEEFNRGMADPDIRKTFWKTVNKKFDIGTFQEFENKIDIRDIFITSLDSTNYSKAKFIKKEHIHKLESRIYILNQKIIYFGSYFKVWSISIFSLLIILFLLRYLYLGVKLSLKIIRLKE